MYDTMLDKYQKLYAKLKDYYWVYKLSKSELMDSLVRHHKRVSGVFSFNHSTGTYGILWSKEKPNDIQSLEKISFDQFCNYSKKLDDKIYKY